MRWCLALGCLGRLVVGQVIDRFVDRGCLGEWGNKWIVLGDILLIINDLYSKNNFSSLLLLHLSTLIDSY